MVEVYDAPWPTLNRGVRVVLVRPPHAPHKVNVEHFQAIHNVGVWTDVEVLEAAIVASEDELEARCDDGPDGAVEQAPFSQNPPATKVSHQRQHLDAGLARVDGKMPNCWRSAR